VRLWGALGDSMRDIGWCTSEDAILGWGTEEESGGAQNFGEGATGTKLVC
jgi:hypothetical protein